MAGNKFQSMKEATTERKMHHLKQATRKNGRLYISGEESFNKRRYNDPTQETRERYEEEVRRMKEALKRKNDSVPSRTVRRYEKAWPRE